MGHTPLLVYDDDNLLGENVTTTKKG